MPLGGGQAHQVVSEEHGAHHGHVGQVGPPTRIGVVGCHDVTGPEVGGPLQGLSHHLAEGAEEPSHPVPLADKLAAGVREAHGEVEHLVDDRALRGSLQGHEHLVGDRKESLPEHVGREPVRGGGFPCHPHASSRMRLPSGSAQARCPGRTRVVAAGSSTMHGPCSSLPGSSPDLPSTATSTTPPCWSRSTTRLSSAGSPTPSWSACREAPQGTGSAGAVADTHAPTISRGTPGSSRA